MPSGALLFIGSKTFTATLADSETGEAFAALGSGNVSVRFEKGQTTNLIPNVQSDKLPSTKVIENGVLYIKHNRASYNVQGGKVK